MMFFSISEDDFSVIGKIDYRPAAVGGYEMDLDYFSDDLHKISDWCVCNYLK